jgi:hypothetical protein
MSQGNDLSPAQDAGVEFENIGFDFGPALAAAEQITSVTSITCSADSGFDPDAQSRLSGVSSIVTSTATSQPNQQVNTQIGHVLGGVMYLIQCVVATTGGQSLSLYTHLPGDWPT